jgi:F-type H+-transporting ATPase subunit gamma
MALNTKVIKTRISSIKNTKKITNAMQMIAAVKMRRSVEAAIKARAYADLVMELLEMTETQFKHPLTIERPVQKHALIVIASNRGLCGNYNANITKKTLEFLERNKNQQIEITAIGRKAAILAKRKQIKLSSIYDKLHEKPNINDIYPITSELASKFIRKEIDKVTVIFTKYTSGIKQDVVTRQLLPLNKNSLQNLIENLHHDIHEQDRSENITEEHFEDYIYEPNKQAIAEFIFPIIFDILLFQAILESSASEHASRMIAMKNATESAGEMLEYLTLEYNKQRQASITQEISEIVAGANAL